MNLTSELGVVTLFLKKSEKEFCRLAKDSTELQISKLLLKIQIGDELVMREELLKASVFPRVACYRQLMQEKCFAVIGERKGIVKSVEAQFIIKFKESNYVWFQICASDERLSVSNIPSSTLENFLELLSTQSIVNITCDQMFSGAFISEYIPFKKSIRKELAELISGKIPSSFITVAVKLHVIVTVDGVSSFLDRTYSIEKRQRPFLEQCIPSYLLKMLGELNVIESAKESFITEVDIFLKSDQFNYLRIEYKKSLPEASSAENFISPIYDQSELIESYRIFRSEDSDDLSFLYNEGFMPGRTLVLHAPRRNIFRFMEHIPSCHLL